MTRLELAKAIYKNNKELGIVNTMSEHDWCKALLYGLGCVKPQRKSELESWLENTNKQIAERA